MKFIYGAGGLGENYAKRLFLNGIKVDGFLDSIKTGVKTVNVNSEKSFSLPILSIEKLLTYKDVAVVCIAIRDSEAYSQVEQKLSSLGVKLKKISDLLPGQSKKDMDALNRDFIAEAHLHSMDDYYKVADSKENLSPFWGENSFILSWFKTLDLSNVVELACGWGRHVPQYIDKAQHIILVDILERNIDICKKRFGENDKISYIVNNGHDLSDLSDNSCTSVFSYDAMVHFELFDIYDYLKEMYRVLKVGGKALLHHSNLMLNYKQTFSNSPHGGRNYMSKDLFAYLAYHAGFEILEQHVMDWSAPNMDCVSLIQKSEN